LPVELEEDGYCFICGKLNADGLRISFEDTEQGITAFFSVPGRFQGYRNIVHGGIIAALLDEASVKLISLKGIRAVTAGMDLRFRKPLMVNERASVHARLISERKKVCEVEATIVKENGEIVADCKAKLFLPDR